MKTVLIIGLGRFGKHLAIDLNRQGHQVLAIDIDEKKVNEVLPFVTNAQIGDSTSIPYLKSLGLNNFDVCFVAIGKSFQSSLETTAALKDLGAKKVVSRAASGIHSKFLLRNGADEIVYPEKQTAQWASIRYSAENVLDYIELDDETSIFEVSIPQNWINSSIKKLDIRRKYDITIIGLKEHGRIDFTIDPDTVLTPEMNLLVLGDYKALQKCFKI